MEPATTRMGIGYRKLGGIALASALIALIGGLSAAPARADDYHRRDVQHERRHPAHRPYGYGPYGYGPYGYGPYGYGAPGYVYAPPPVYYAPPPQPPPVDLVFPLIFR